MLELSYATARPVTAAAVEIGDQILFPYGYRVVYDIQPEGENLRFFFWDEEPIVRIGAASIQTMKRVA